MLAASPKFIAAFRYSFASIARTPLRRRRVSRWARTGATLPPHKHHRPEHKSNSHLKRQGKHGFPRGRWMHSAAAHDAEVPSITVRNYSAAPQSLSRATVLLSVSPPNSSA
jgi:hypothetical protein